MDVDVNRNEVSDDSSYTDTKTFIAGISWIAIPAKPNRPGMKVTLDGNKTDTTDHVHPNLSVDDYQLFFRVNVGLSALY